MVLGTQSVGGVNISEWWHMMQLSRYSLDDPMLMGRTTSSSSSVSCMPSGIVRRTRSHSRSIRIVSLRSHGSRRKMPEPSSRELPKTWSSSSSSIELFSGSSQMNTKTLYSSGKPRHGARSLRISGGSKNKKSHLEYSRWDFLLYFSYFDDEESLRLITREYSYWLRQYIWVVSIFAKWRKSTSPPWAAWESEIDIL